MMKNEECEAKRAFWLQHLRECAACGEHLSVYAQRQGLEAMRHIAGRDPAGRGAVAARRAEGE